MRVFGGIPFSDVLSISVTLSVVGFAAAQAGITVTRVFKSQMHQA